MDYWLILEKSDETRVSKGIEGYEDLTGKIYNYDSLVPNHKNLKIRDRVVLRKENQIVGVGTISEISEFDSAKLHRRCVSCNSTDIRKRKIKIPKWKCGKCKFEFSDPVETILDVRAYQASISDFTLLREPLGVKLVKDCAAKGDGVESQLSILKLDPIRITALVKFPSVGFGPGFVDESINRRQDEFENEVRKSKSDSPAHRLRRLKSAHKKPPVIYSVTKTYKRNPDVVAEVLIRADGICENCQSAAPFRRRKDSSPYLEVHHKIQLAVGGNDTVENAIALCPNCHREMHYG